MSRKIFFSFTLMLIAALMLSGTAFAATGQATTRQVNRVGRITAFGSSSLTIQGIGGGRTTVKVGINTQFQRVSGGTPSFHSLSLGQWVTAIGTFDTNRVLNANTIVVMPANLNRGHWTGKRAYGTLIQAIPGSRTFTLTTENGLMRFTVKDSTTFTGNSVRHFGALESGMHVVVGYTQLRDGTLVARSVGAY